MIANSHGDQDLELLPMRHFSPEAVRARINEYLLALKKISADSSRPSAEKNSTCADSTTVEVTSQAEISS
jgi:hypothetical protein